MPENTDINPLDIGKEKGKNESDFLKNIVSGEAGNQEKIILDEAPEIDTSLLEELPPPKSLLLLVLKITFSVILGLSAMSFLFFGSQLSDNLNFFTERLKISNASTQLASTNAEIISLQTDLNLYRYLQLNGFFNSFTKDSDSFLINFDIQKSQTVSQEERDGASQEVIDLKKSLKDSFTKIQKLYSEGFTSPLIDQNFSTQEDLEKIYLEKTLAKLDDKINELKDKTDPQVRRDLKAYAQTKNLISNMELRNLILQTDFSAMDELKLLGFIKTANSMIINDLSIIRKIKDARIKWSEIINEIDLRSKVVDRHYSEDSFDLLGGIRYTNYDFETAERKISIIGETKTFNTENFSVIADLIDELNKSRFFTDAEMRSFSKSGSLDDGFVANLKLSVNLQDGEIDKEDNDLEINKKPEFLEDKQ